MKKFQLQDPGEGVHEVEVHEVLVSPGDKVEEGQDVFVVESDKSAIELPSPYSGTVDEIRVKQGDVVQVGDVLMTVETNSDTTKTKEQPDGKGDTDDNERAQEQNEDNQVEDVSEQEETPTDEANRTKSEEEIKGSDEENTEQSKKIDNKTDDEFEHDQSEEPVKASPATRRVARELDVDLRSVTPSGPKGRVTKEDVRAFSEEGQYQEKHGRSKQQSADLPDFSQWGDIETTKLNAVRRSMARRMTKAWSEIPHVNHQDFADVTELEFVRQEMAAQVEDEGGQLTMTVFALKAVSSLLKEHSKFNASFNPDAQEIILKHYIHIGVALDTERGLMVPVIRDVDHKSLVELAIELKELAERLRRDMPTKDDLAGGSFTITNVGSIGGTFFSPIINYPQSAILGMGRARYEVVPVDVSHQTLEKAKFEARFHLPFCVAFDHRIIDGAEAAKFASQFKETMSSKDSFILSV